MFLRTSYIFLLCVMVQFWLSGQSKYQAELTKTPEVCDPGSAQINIKGQGQPDSVYITWNTGEVNLRQIRLKAGDYSVRVFTEHRDSLKHRKDTTIYFVIEKEVCPVSVPKYFSPNDDGFNDRMDISNIYAYPEFELIIYNKLGQRVHHQKKTFQEWDGKWLGTDLPDGTYYYVLFFDASKKSDFVKGDVTILR